MQEMDKAPKIRFALSLVCYLGLTLFAMLVWHVTLNDLVIYQQEKNTQMDDFMVKQKKEITGLEARQKKLMHSNLRINFIASLTQKNNEALALLQGIHQTIPSSIILGRLKREGRQLTLDATSPSDVELIQLLANMNRSSFLKPPIITSLSAFHAYRYFQLKTEIKLNGN